MATVIITTAVTVLALGVLAAIGIFICCPSMPYHEDDDDTY